MRGHPHAPTIDTMYSLTREDARHRSETTQLTHVDVRVDLTGAASTAEETYPVTSVLTLTLRSARLVVDVAGSVERVWVDDREHRVEHDGERLVLDDLPLGRELRIRVDAHCSYSHTGEGLHRYTDPEDQRVYLYTQFEPNDAHRAWPCLDQPDIKPRWTFHVDAPEGWVVASNGAGSALVGAPGVTHHDFTTTPPLSSYITALVAGQWAVVDGGVWRGGASGPGADGNRVEVPLRLLCRTALAPWMDSEDILEVTRAGLDHYHRHYGTTFPWGTYDQVFVPEYNLGAMENPGCVTFNEGYLSRDTPTFADRQERANTILHEMCHMWFGDLATPAWWDDLWLKESFADHQGTHTASVATRYTGEWASFALADKAWAYAQDQYPTTHPIAADVVDVAAAKTNFDGITYAKGASVLKQLFAWVGEDTFFEGARAYFRDHAFASTRLEDLLRALGDASGRDLGAWARAWLHTTRPSVLTCRVGEGPMGDVELELVQSAPAGQPLVLRPHMLVVSTWAVRGDALVRTHGFDVRIDGERARVDEGGSGHVRAGDCDLVVVNDRDLTYALTRLDPRSTRTALDHLASCPDALTRAVVWSSLWNMTRDAQLPAADFVRAVLSQGVLENEDAVLDRLLAFVNRAVEDYAPGSARDALRRETMAAAHGAIARAAHTDRARSWARALSRCFLHLTSPDPGEVAEAQALADGRMEGVDVGGQLSWSARWGLAVHGLVGRDELDAWRDAEGSGEAHVRHARALASLPDPELRAHLWEEARTGSLSNEMLSATLEGLSAGRGGIPPRDCFPALLPHWESHTIDMARRFVDGAFPSRIDVEDSAASDAVVEGATAWLGDNPDAPGALRRLVVEKLDDVVRALRNQGVTR